MPTDPTLIDRARGTLVASALGDALGAGYEFCEPMAADAPVAPIGGGVFDWEPGEWTDETALAIAVAEAAASGADLTSEAGEDRIVARWLGWAAEAKNMASQTRWLIEQAGDRARARGAGSPRAVDLRAVAAAPAGRPGTAGSNSVLLRVAPVALCFATRPGEAGAAATARTAASLTGLSHTDAEAAEAAALWALAIREALLGGRPELRALVEAEPEGRAVVAVENRARWEARIGDAERFDPGHFDRNGWVVQAIQGAWSAVARQAGPVETLRIAVRGGNDADGVAAIAGGLVGALHGRATLAEPLVEQLHGWPGVRADYLDELAVRTLSLPS